MRKGIYLLPNSITLCGMFAGFFAIILSLDGQYLLASWAIIVAGIFDALDGSVARLTNTTSKFGVELDSLSDSIAFGVAPALMAYTWALTPFGRVGIAVAFLFMACGALRLARFNVQKETTEKKYFTGMPIPAAAAIIASTVMFYIHMDWNPVKSMYVFVVMIILAVLMVSTMRFHSLKELNLKGRKPFFILVFFVLLLAIISMHPEVTLFSIGLIYLWGGVLENVILVLMKGKKPATS